MFHASRKSRHESKRISGQFVRNQYITSPAPVFYGQRVHGNVNFNGIKTLHLVATEEMAEKFLHNVELTQQTVIDRVENPKVSNPKEKTKSESGYNSPFKWITAAAVVIAVTGLTLFFGKHN